MNKIIKIIYRLFGKIYVFLEYHGNEYVYEKYRKKYDISKSFKFNGSNIFIYGEGKIHFGDRSYIGRNSILQCSEGSNIVIGNNCKIGPRFSVWTNSSKVDADFNKKESIDVKVGDIIINDAVWIGANVTISPGVIIGENSIIGANSVVTSNVQPFSIVGGVPAKIIRFKNLK